MIPQPALSLRSSGLRRWFVAGIVALFVLLAPHVARAEWRNLDGPFPDFTGNINYVISPDSLHVAYTADRDTDDVVELYIVPITDTVPITGTLPIKLNPPLVEGGNVSAFRVTFSPDSQFVYYLADQEVDNRVELYRVPATGGDALRISRELVVGGNVGNYKIDVSNARIVYLADAETNDVQELWSVPLEGGDSVKVSGALVTGGNVGTFELDPLSDRVVYSADAETNGKSELYSALITGGSVVKLNPPIVLTGGGDGGIGSQFAVNPVIPVVVFIARETGSNGGRVYSIPTAGGSLNQLSFNLTAEQRILHFRISPLGDRVVFNVGTRVGSTNAFSGNLYSNLIGAGGAANVTETADPLFGTDDFQFLPDGSRVVYTFQNSAASAPRLESATVLGVRTTLHAPLPDDDQLLFFRLSPDSQWVVYTTEFSDFQTRIASTPPTSSGSVNHGVGRIEEIAPDSSRIAFLAETDGDRHTDLFTRQIFGGGQRNLSGLNDAGFANSAHFSPNSNWVVFIASVGNRTYLRVSDGEEAQPPISALTAANDGPQTVGAPVTFTSTITGGVDIDFAWDFGDGSTGSGAGATHVYTAAGVYTATLTASALTNVMTATTTVHIGHAVVEVTDNAYTPRDVTIPEGGTVVWVLKEGNHSVTADDGSFEQSAGTDWGVFTHTFTDVTTSDVTTSEVTASEATQTVITYHCTVHGASMSGSVTVGEAAPPENQVLLPMIGN